MIGRILFRLVFHPLARYPGPKAAAVSNLPYVYWTISGQLHQRLRELHDEYGEVVRIRPNALTYTSSQAWKDIYGRPKSGVLPFDKDPEFYATPMPGKASLLNANDADHTRHKRLVSSAFSDRAMREQESIIMSYIDLFIGRLHDLAKDDHEVSLEEWFNFLTFDIVGDLAFGEPFGCLEGSGYHHWVSIIFKGIKSGAFLKALSVYPSIATCVRRLLPKKVTEEKKVHQKMSRDRVSKRLESQVSRPDFISHIQKHESSGDDSGRGMQRSEIEANAALIIMAGSETTATVLSAAVYYLTKNPACWQKAIHEVRGTYRADQDIDFLTTRQLTYINSVIEETLRMFPPMPGIAPRVVPPGGAVINELYVPEGVGTQYA